MLSQRQSANPISPSHSVGLLHLSQRGLSLIEMLLATLVLSLVIGLVSPMLMNGFHIWQRTEQASSATHELRSVVDWITGDLRDADQIVDAQADQIQVLRGGQNVHYALESGTLNTWRGASEHHVLASQVQQFQLRYFDKNENQLDGSTPLDAGQISRIRRIQVQLDIQEPSGKSRDAQTSIYRQQGRYAILREGYIPEHAILCGGPLTMDGKASITGSSAHAHTNQDMVFQAEEDSFVRGDLRAVGSITLTGDPLVLGEIAQGVDPFVFPDIVPSRYRSWADVILAADGTVRDQDGHTVATGGYGGWLWEEGQWKQSDANPMHGTYYVETRVLIEGSEDTSLWRVTVISERSIHVQGKYQLQSRQNGLLLLAGTGITLTAGGTGDDDDDDDDDDDETSEQITCSGYLFCNGSFVSHGALRLQGAVIAAGAAQLHGSFELDYSPTGDKAFPDLFARVDSWHRVGE